MITLFCVFGGGLVAGFCIASMIYTLYSRPPKKTPDEWVLEEDISTDAVRFYRPRGK